MASKASRVFCSTGFWRCLTIVMRNMKANLATGLFCFLHVVPNLHTRLYCTALPIQTFALTYPACRGLLSLRHGKCRPPKSLCTSARISVHMHECAYQNANVQAPETAPADASQRAAMSNLIARYYACGHQSDNYAKQQAINFDGYCCRHADVCVQPHMDMHANACRRQYRTRQGECMREKSSVT